MKKLLIGISSIILLLVALTACGNHKEVPTTDTASNISTIESGVWPENEYTENVPQPETGTVTNGWIDSEKMYCYIEFSGMDETDSETYIKKLKENGYKEIDKVSEKIEEQDYISVGTILSNGKVSLSISYLQEHFGLYISFEE